LTALQQELPPSQTAPLMVSATRRLPERSPRTGVANALAAFDSAAKRVVLDYVVTYATANWSFYGGTTYYVPSSFYASSQATFGCD